MAVGALQSPYREVALHIQSWHSKAPIQRGFKHIEGLHKAPI